MTQYQRHTVSTTAAASQELDGHVHRSSLRPHRTDTAVSRAFKAFSYLHKILPQTERRGRGVSTTSLYSGGTRVNSRSGDRTAILMDIINPSWQISGQFQKLGYDRFLATFFHSHYYMGNVHITLILWRVRMMFISPRLS